MDFGRNILDKFDEEKYSLELMLSRYRNLAREKFQDYIEFDVSPVNYVKECVKNYALNLPQEFNEFIINMDYAPFYWLADLPVILQTEEFFRRKGYHKQDGATGLGEIRKFYSKWVMQKTEKEKQFFALSTINLVERNTNKYNYLKYILQAVILTFDRRIRSFEKAETSLEKARSIVEAVDLDANLASEILYLIDLHLGFVKYKSGQYYEAGQKFRAALSSKPSGATAVLYCALSEKEQDNTGEAVELISNLMNLDARRLEYAISESKLELFNFFMKNAYIYNVFQESAFATMQNNIEYIVESMQTGDRKFLEKITSMIGRFEELRLKDKYTDEVIKQLKFLEEFLTKYRNSVNVLVLMCGNILTEKFRNITNILLDSIKQTKMGSLSESLRVYDVQLKDAGESVKSLRKHSGEKREVIAKKMEESIKIIEEEYKEKIEYLTKVLESVDGNEKFDSGKAFSTAMFYNLVISLLIFVVGGFGSGLISGDSIGSSFSSFIINGMKFGGITFVIGFFVALFTAASTVTEKSGEKGRVEKRIEIMKQEREMMIKHFQMESQERLTSFDKGYRDDLDREESRVDKLSKEKTLKLQSLNDKVEEEMKQYRDMIAGVFKD